MKDVWIRISFLPAFPSSLLSDYALNRQDKAAEETWVRGQFSLYREWYGGLMEKIPHTPILL